MAKRKIKQGRWKLPVVSDPVKRCWDCLFWSETKAHPGETMRVGLCVHRSPAMIDAMITIHPNYDTRNRREKQGALFPIMRADSWCCDFKSKHLLDEIKRPVPVWPSGYQSDGSAPPSPELPYIESGEPGWHSPGDPPHRSAARQLQACGRRENDEFADPWGHDLGGEG